MPERPLGALSDFNIRTGKMQPFRLLQQPMKSRHGKSECLGDIADFPGATLGYRGGVVVQCKRSNLDGVIAAFGDVRARRLKIPTFVGLVTDGEFHWA